MAFSSQRRDVPVVWSHSLTSTQVLPLPMKPCVHSQRATPRALTQTDEFSGHVSMSSHGFVTAITPRRSQGSRHGAHRGCATAFTEVTPRHPQGSRHGAHRSHTTAPTGVAPRRPQGSRHGTHRGHATALTGVTQRRSQGLGHGAHTDLATAYQRSHHGAHRGHATASIGVRSRRPQGPHQGEISIGRGLCHTSISPKIPKTSVIQQGFTPPLNPVF